LVALLIAGLWGGYNLLTGSLKTEVKLGRNQVEAATVNGADAVNTVGQAAATEAASDDLTRSNTDEIRKADGAAVPVAAGVNTAGLRALCRRAAYRGQRECLQLADPAGVAQPGSGR
jgi:hypothetical protein